MWGSVYLADSQQSVSIAAVNRRCHVCDTVFCQGDCVLTVQLDEDEEKEADFYLIFSGSTQRHVSSTLRVSHVTLQAMCPGITHTHTRVHMHAHTHTRAVGWVDFWNTRTESAEVLQVDESMCVHMTGAASEPSCFHRPLKQSCVGSTNPDLSSVRLGSGAWDHPYRFTVWTPVLSSSYFML